MNEHLQLTKNRNQYSRAVSESSPAPSVRGMELSVDKERTSGALCLAYAQQQRKSNAGGPL